MDKVIKGCLKKTKKKASPKGKALGQAPALPMRLWAEWLKWILLTCGSKIFFVIFLTGALGLRCGEALCIKTTFMTFSSQSTLTHLLQASPKLK